MQHNQLMIEKLKFMNQLEREILLEMMLIEFENINKYLKKIERMSF